MNKSNVLALLFLGVFIDLLIARSVVAEVTHSTVNIGEPQLNIPRCLSSESNIAEIQSALKANAKSSAKYDGYRRILRADGDQGVELATRLAYAETLAANCSTYEDNVLDLVASVIGNRIRIRRGDIPSVVFQRDQFASSLNIYAESRYRDFLCPQDAALWKKVFIKMSANLAAIKPSAPIPSDAVNYYLYRHSDRFKAPGWKLEEVPLADDKTRECIGVFRDAVWR